MQSQVLINRERNHDSDLKLAKLTAGGDPQACRMISSRLLAQVRRTMSYMVNDPSLAEDLTHFSIMSLLPSSSTFFR